MMRLPLTDEITVWSLFAIGVIMVAKGMMSLTGGVDYARGSAQLAVGFGTMLLMMAPLYRRMSILEVKQEGLE